MFPSNLNLCVPGAQARPIVHHLAMMQSIIMRE